MIESRRETDPVAGHRFFVPAFAGWNRHPDQCAEPCAEERANACDRASAHNVTLSAAAGQLAAGSPEAGADTSADHRIDAAGAGTLTHVQPRDFLAQHRDCFRAARHIVQPVGGGTLATLAAILAVYGLWQVFRWGGREHQVLIGNLA